MKTERFLMPNNYNNILIEGRELISSVELSNSISIIIIVDINECMAAHHCEHNCVNTVGTYTCNCDDGYLLADNGYACYGR